MPRQSAFACNGKISFSTLDGKQIGEVIPLKWDLTPQPVTQGISGGRVVLLFEHNLVRQCEYIDIPPDGKESFALAVRMEIESEAYGWTPESYRPDYDWRYPRSQLPTGEYFAHIEIYVPDCSPFKSDFRFSNPSNFDGFDLIRPDKQESVL